MLTEIAQRDEAQFIHGFHAKKGEDWLHGYDYGMVMPCFPYAYRKNLDLQGACMRRIFNTLNSAMIQNNKNTMNREG